MDMIASGNNVAYMGLTSANSLEATGARTPADALGEPKRMSDLEDGSEESDVACPTCGDVFASEHGVKIHRAKTHNETVKPVLECEWCGDEFTVKPKRKDSARFCSPECRDTHRRGGEKPPAELLRRLHWDKLLSANKMADIVGHPRQVVERWMDDYGIERRSQSEAERLKWEQMTEEQRAEQVSSAHEAISQAVEDGKWHLQLDNPNRNGYGEGWTEEKRERVREMYNRTCQACGVTESDHINENGLKLDVHHVIPAANFDDAERRNAVDNLVVLCRSCHRKWEGIPLSPQLED